MASQRGSRERRVVSMLFCDLVGFTDFSDGADPEDVDVLLEDYFTRARAQLLRQGGEIRPWNEVRSVRSWCRTTSPVVSSSQSMPDLSTKSSA